MNILYLCPSPNLNLRDHAGWTTHMRSVMVGLRAHGRPVRQFVESSVRPPPHAARSWLRRAAPAALRLARRDLAECWHDLRLRRRVLDACRESHIEAIYERTEVYHAVGMRVARHLNLPLIVEVNGPLVEERLSWGGLLLPRYARHIEAAKYAAADRVVTVSAALAGHLAAQGVDPKKIAVVQNGVDTALFNPHRADPGAIRRQFGLGRRLVIGFVGAFADWHRLDALLVAAAEVLHDAKLDIHLLLVGDGPSRPALRELA